MSSPPTLDRRSLALGGTGSVGLGLAVFSEELGIVAGKLLQLDEEVTEVELEAVAGVVQCEETLDESLNLLAVKLSVNVTIG